VQKGASNNPTCTVFPFCGGAAIFHNNKVAMPLQLRTHVARWCHEMSCHPGERRKEETMRQRLTWPGLKSDALKCVKKCPNCQKGKEQKKKYGHMPPKLDELQPWEHLCVDMISKQLL
jgi:hypothetical protein